MTDLRKPCEHGYFDSHQATIACPAPELIAYSEGASASCTVLHTYSCPGGTKPTLDDLKEALGPDFMVMRKMKIDYPGVYPTL